VSAVPLLVALDFEGSEQFVIVTFDAAIGVIRRSSNAMTEQEARDFFTSNGEDEYSIGKRFQSARDHKGKV
jgi:hypothetical protein